MPVAVVTGAARRCSASAVLLGRSGSHDVQDAIAWVKAKLAAAESTNRG